MPDIIHEFMDSMGNRITFYKRDDWCIGITIKHMDSGKSITASMSPPCLQTLVSMYSNKMWDSFTELRRLWEMRTR